MAVLSTAPAAARPAPDRAPDELAAGTPEPLRRELVATLGAEQVLDRAIDLVMYASDASPYRRFPKAVVRPRDEDDVAKLFAWSRGSGVPLTFRAAGTSLNGQSQGDGVLVDARHHWRGVEVLDGGERARVRPGTVLGHANRVLARHGRKLGPDPASSDFATVGGVVANNSGGMRCGVTRDSYSTVGGLRFVLPSGTAIDTAAPGASERFAAAEPELAAGLAAIREEIRAEPALAERIRRKFEIKNTTGYRLCAFLDADEPLEIFRRLLVGSEGTLAFVSEVTFETVPRPPKTTVSWLHFASIEDACDPVPELVAAGASAVELMVAPALIAASHSIPGAPEAWRELPPESAALLVEFGDESDEELAVHATSAGALLADRELIRKPDFTRDAEAIEVNWRVREGLHGLIGKLRPEGTALIVEDVCVPPARVAAAAKDLQALLGKHGFLPGVAGHASAGNLHFMLTPDFAEAAERERYEAFMAELVDLVLDRYDGSLKAEHGTGVNMAPFVEREWGGRATELMWRVKGLADPDGILAPGVVLNRDPGVHLRDLKTTPPIEEVATSCVECGFCEPVCPSRHLTTTPRQRIVIRREMVRQPAGSPVLAALTEQYAYDGIETCAADGTCALSCPVGIDTGKLVKGFRREAKSERAERVALGVARRFAAAERGARAGLRAGGALGGAPGRALSSLARAALGNELVPAWPRSMPPPAPARPPETSRDGAAAVYLPACINRILGNPLGAPRRPTLAESVVAVSERAGLPVWIPPDAAGTCCATPWSSKGFQRGHELVANRLVDSLWRWSGGGELPVVIDASSCALGAGAEVVPALSGENAERHAMLEILDGVSWAHDRLLPRLELRRKLGSATVHPPCATRHLGLAATLERLARGLADEVTVPITTTCCGMAGDRGMLHPELTAAATAEEASEVRGGRFDAYLSTNRTCELALEEATGAPYRSPILVLDELTR